MEPFISKQQAYARLLPSSCTAVAQRDLEQWGLSVLTLRHYQLEGLNWLVRRHGTRAWYWSWMYYRRRNGIRKDSTVNFTDTVLAKREEMQRTRSCCVPALGAQ